MSAQIRVLEPVQAAEVASWLASLDTDAHLLCPVTAQFIRWPVIEGEVDPEWITTNAPRYQGQTAAPLLGTPLIKSRFSNETFPCTMLRVARPVQGERREIERDKAMLADLRQQLAVANNFGAMQKSLLDSANDEKLSLSTRIADLDKTVDSYTGMLRSMQMCIDLKNEELLHKEPPEQLAELTRKVAEQEESISKLRDSEMKLSSEQITLKENAEQDKELIRCLEKSNRELIREHNEKETVLKREVEELRKKVAELEMLGEPSRKMAKERKVTMLLGSEEPAHAETDDDELDEPKENIEKTKSYAIEDADVVKKLLAAHELRAVHKYNEATRGLTLFDSISDQLERDCGIEQSATELLSNLIKYLELNREVYEKKLLETKKKQKKTSFAMYLDAIRNGDVSEVAVEALSNQLQRHIWVFASNDILKFDDFASTAAPLKIAYFTGEHCFYRSTEPLDTVIEIND